VLVRLTPDVWFLLLVVVVAVPLAVGVLAVMQRATDTTEPELEECRRRVEALEADDR
jgi:hypothetical protein